MEAKQKTVAQHIPSPQTDTAHSAQLRRRVFIGVMIVVALVVAAYFAVSGAIAERVARPERHPFTNTPALYGLKYEDVKFSSTDNIPLSGWYIDSPGDRVIILLHGWNGSRDGGVNLKVANELARRNFDVLMFDFRGHGASGGEHYGLGTLETRDLGGALNYLKTRGVNKVGAIGFSMGGATLLNGAPDHPEIRALVADSAFADLKPLLEERLAAQTGLPPIFNPGILLMYRVMFGEDLAQDAPANSIKKLGDRPLLFIYGTADDLVPQSQFELSTRAGAGDLNFRVWKVEGAGHTAIYDAKPKEYAQRVGDFFDANLK